MARIYFLFILILLSFNVSSQNIPADITLNDVDRIELTKAQLWRHVPTLNRSPDFSELHLLYKNTANAISTLGQSGAFAAKIKLINNSPHDIWFVSLHVNYLDVGQAYWQTSLGEIIPLDNFSQNDNRGPKLNHSQSFSLPIKKGEQGTLWIYVEAKIFATSAEVSFKNKTDFFHSQFLTNSITTISYTVMLTLALMAFVIYLRTRYMVTLACTGYLGIHGLGWLSASGGLGNIFDVSGFNPVYLGILLFPFAIASACQFTKLLFNCQYEHLRLANIFNWLSISCVVIGIVMPLFAFPVSFLISHIIAVIWIPLCIGTGIFMLKRNEFKAKYYLLGNLVYGLSLSWYVLSHFQALDLPFSAELFVQMALTFDCMCIILSLSEWLQIKQKEFNRSYQVSRIDPLTKIGNRFAQNEMLTTLNEAYCLTFIDLDFLKKVNDTLGHHEGDKILITTAKIIQQKIKNLGAIFRCGGDEFILIVNLQSSKQAKSMLSILSDILLSTEKELRQMGWKNIGISYGTATSFETSNQSECLSLADQRMYQCKKKKH